MEVVNLSLHVVFAVNVLLKRNLCLVMTKMLVFFAYATFPDGNLSHRDTLK
jgi:hypothetical protein